MFISGDALTWLWFVHLVTLSRVIAISLYYLYRGNTSIRILVSLCVVSDACGHSLYPSGLNSSITETFEY